MYTRRQATMQRTSPAATLVLAYLAFISLGLPDAVLGVAWPSLRDEFGLPQSLLGAPLAVTAMAYFFSGLLAGRLTQQVGLGLLLTGSTALVAAGVGGFSMAPAFVLFLMATPMVGFGSGAIDAALNTHAARHFSRMHMSWMHAAYAAGAMTGPSIMTAVLTRGASWRAGYVTVAVLLLALAVGFVFTRQHWSTAQAQSPGPSVAEELRVGTFTALKSATVWLQIAIFFVYTGLEVSAGQWSYTVLTEDRGLSAPMAGTWVALYWGGLLAGRLVLGLVVERIGQVLLLRLATLGVLVCAVLFALPARGWSAAALPFLSFSLASIYPGLMAETPRRVGDRLAPHAVGFQVSAATAGVAIVPTLIGLLSQHVGLTAVGPALATCALVLLVLHELLVRRR